MTARIQTYRLALRKDRVIHLAESTAGEPTRAHSIAHAYLRDAPSEVLIALLLDGMTNVCALVPLATTGSLSSCSCNVAAPFRAALAHGNVGAIILAHNHPSGDPTPSEDDKRFTREMVRAGKVVGISVVDHVIVTRAPHRWTSFQNLGLLEDA